jgi:glycerate 2-kinase
MNTTLRKAAMGIFHRTLAAIDVESVVRAYLKVEGERLIAGEEIVDLRAYSRLLVIGIGKACIPMARVVESLLGDRISGGLAVTNAVIGPPLEQIETLIGGHPLPNSASFEAAAKALALLRENDGEETLVLFLITGGGSAMFELPIDPELTLDDLQAVNRVLVGCGARIGEINIVRRSLSAVKGGRLAAAAPRSRRISLYISDVNSDDLSAVASGPTIPSPATAAEFCEIVDRHRLIEKFPVKVAALIERNLKDSEAFDRAAQEISGTHHLLLDDRRALAAAKRIAESEYGMKVEIAEDLVEGDVESMMQIHLERVDALRRSAPDRMVCLLSGGEVMCPVRGDGLGGRNQEFVLRAAIHLELRGLDEIVVLSAGADGIDGNSPAAGAVADAESIRRAASAGISAEGRLINSDSYRFFEPLGDAIITGPTGNNVRDLRILTAELKS